MTLMAPFLRARLQPVFLLAAMLVFASSAALADDTPFDFESSNWMSFDRYKDQPSHWLAPDQRTMVQQQPVVAAPPVLPASMPNLTEPTRPISTPVMPSMNGGYDIKIDSTEDGHRLPENQLSPPQDDKWQTAVEAARQKDLEKKAGSNSNDFTVRFSALPAWSMPEKAISLPVKPAEKTTPAPVKIAEPAALKPPPPPAVKAIDPAVCAALDAYKKRQLQAIQSDRETLKALQNAISQLGLQKQLDFMPGASGSMNMQAGEAKN